MSVNEKNIKKYQQTLRNYLKFQLPKILSLLDRDPYSKTYGCFDREFWHFKSKGFFNGMNQCNIFSLALYYSTEYEGNYLYKVDKLKKYILAAIKFSINHCHRDGSFDEHYYNEHSIAATSFVLFSITETILLLDLRYKQFLDYFEKACHFLLKNKENYIRANHIASNVSAYYNLYLITSDKKYRQYAEEFLEDLLKYKSKEGWFREYKGCDPGYNTLTLYFLAKYALKANDKLILDVIRESISFSSHFMHPDHSFGGFYGSRNTMHFFPYSFEYIKMENHIGKQMVNSFIEAINSGTSELLLDDRFCFLHLINILEIFAEFKTERPLQTFDGPLTTKWFPQAGIYIYRAHKYHAILNYKKGGILYVFKNHKLVLRFCSIIVHTNHGLLKSSGFTDVSYTKTNEGFRINGVFTRYHNNKTLTPLTSLLFNLFNLTLGNIKIFRKVVKKYLIKKLILKEKTFNLHYRVDITFGNTIKLKFKIERENPKLKITSLRISSYNSDLYVPSGKMFQIHDIMTGKISLNKSIQKDIQKDSINFTLSI
ncbi:MAG: hypothetical protein R6U96_15565 [Promethearchaeia archaeon]